MKERRLKDLITLGCENDLTDTIDLNTVVDCWAKQPKTQRLIRCEVILIVIRRSNRLW